MCRFLFVVSLTFASLCTGSAAEAKSCVAGSDDSCRSRDSQALLQGKLLVDHDVSQTAKVECSEMDKEFCPTGIYDQCTWSGFKCETGCRHFKSQASCPDYCHWDTKDRDTNGDGNQVARCRAQLGGVNIGGKKSIAQGRHVGRPQFATMEHCSAAKGWQPCGGEDNCITGQSTMYLKADLSSPEYTETAMEVDIDCEGSEALYVYLERSNFPASNAKLKVWYNLEEQDVSPFDLRTERLRTLKIPISSSDAHPVLRVEVSRADATKPVNLVKMKIRLRPTVAIFDKCMGEKFKYAQCTDLIGNTLLRSDRDGQVACLEGGDTSMDGCEEWRSCLEDFQESKNMILKINKAMSKKPGGQALMQVKSAAQSEEMGPCTGGGHGECIDPKVFDVEAFDCNCFDEIDEMSAEDIHNRACSRPDVCCSWKANHCSGVYKPVLAQMNTSGGSVKVASMDEALTTKKTC